MITIKKSINIGDDYLYKMIKQYSSVVRFSYNRIIKDNITSLSELEKIVKSSMNNIDLLDASWIKCAVKESTQIKRDSKIYFGSKRQFFNKKYHRKSIYNKSISLNMRGSKNDRGNRKFKLDINNSLITFKPVKGKSIEIKLNLSKKEFKLLNYIEYLSKNKQGYFNVKLSLDKIWISFNEPTLSTYKPINNRILGLDLNPNYIGISIMDDKKEVFKKLIDLKSLNKKSTEKVNYELVIISNYIVKLCKHYLVDKVGIEDLTMISQNHRKGKYYNRLVNRWNRNLLVNNLTKNLNLNGVKYKFVNPFYTSFIGQLKNINDYDPIAASKEVAYRVNIENEYKYVQDYLDSEVSTQWKEMISDVKSNRDLYTYFKNNPKSSYRVFFNDNEKSKLKFFRLKSYKSMIDLITF